MKHYKKCILLLLLIIVCMNYHINGSEQENSLEMLLFSAAKSRNTGHLGIYYDPNYSLSNDSFYTGDLENFRNKQENTDNIIDYEVHTRVFKTPVGKTGSVAERKHLFTLLENTDTHKRGLVIYYTHTNAEENYIDKIKKIREIGWPVVVICHKLSIAQQIEKEFFKDNNMSKSIIYNQESHFYRNVFIMSALFLTFGFWYRR